ncbi:glycosyltransferase family 4 protein [Desulfonatronum thiodismutans]|uniref:glycosyltransferase family 4 protein n=1 Tax=Desulfonatronum thiodismutans TaxID=159290 RepID=UPI0004ABEB62|nr:glycosyltransferase family 1 protein [Desulfonatronum thiodismutans]
MTFSSVDLGIHRPLRVGLNLLYLLPGIVGGTETYAAGLLRGLAEADDGLEYVVFLNQESADWPLPDIPAFQRVICPVRASNRVRRLLYEQFRLPALARRHGVDVLHSLGYVGPVLGRCPGVVTIHDMNTKGHGRSMPLSKRLALAFLVRCSAHAARQVITVSEFSRREIHHHLDLPLERIQVVYEAPLPPTSVHQKATASPVADASLHKQPPQADAPFILAFASQSPHKNIPRLIEAFARIAPSVPHHLILAGHLPGDGAADRAISRWDIAHRVRLTGYLPRAEVDRLLSKAALFAFPSMYEGFGLPVLEAQAAETPVACARRGALPEVAGEGAVFFDPENVLDMAATLAHALTDEDLRHSLVAQGRLNLKRFSWTEAARQTLDLYARAAWRGRNRYVGPPANPSAVLGHGASTSSLDHFADESPGFTNEESSYDDQTLPRPHARTKPKQP